MLIIKVNNEFYELKPLDMNNVTEKETFNVSVIFEDSMFTKDSTREDYINYIKLSSNISKGDKQNHIDFVNTVFDDKKFIDTFISTIDTMRRYIYLQGIINTEELFNSIINKCRIYTYRTRINYANNMPVTFRELFRNNYNALININIVIFDFYKEYLNKSPTLNLK